MDPQCFLRLTLETDHEYPTAYLYVSVELAAFTNEEKRQRRRSIGAREVRNRWSSRKKPLFRGFVSFDWSGSQLLRLRAHGFFHLLVLIDI